jgi:hypothetical protein
VGPERHYVFGYGSLLERLDGDHGGPIVCRLSNYRRTWNVAMDNARTVPGYKYYVDPATGVRPRWFVTFLNIVPDPAASANGVAFEVTERELAHLDRRERNYDRIDVSGAVSLPVDGRVWAYAGSAAAVARFELGRGTGRAMVHRRYYESVRDDFACVGPGALAEFNQSTDPPPCPLIDLERVDLPHAPTASSFRVEVK